ncbi:hypothetical protein BT93_J1978 [Corymbia citriodora subsp. variegata]|nr:hypothetical protein BT93_J1978 [Corymbia citriodora subsp. variegata]
MYLQKCIQCMSAFGIAWCRRIASEMHPHQLTSPSANNISFLFQGSRSYQKSQVPSEKGIARIECGTLAIIWIRNITTGKAKAMVIFT